MELITLYIILLLFIVVILNSNLKPISKLNLLSSYSEKVFRKITIRDDLTSVINSTPAYIDLTDDNLLTSLGIHRLGFLSQSYEILGFTPLYEDTYNPIINKYTLGYFETTNDRTITKYIDTYYLNGNTAGTNTGPVIIYIFKPYKNIYNVYYGITEDYQWYKLTINFQEYKIDYVLIADKIPGTSGVGFRYITNTLSNNSTIESTFHIVGTDGNLYTTGYFNESLINTKFKMIVSAGNIKSIFKIPTTQEYLIITNDGALYYIYNLFDSLNLSTLTIDENYKMDIKKISDGIITSNKKFNYYKGTDKITDEDIYVTIDTNFVGYEYITRYNPPLLDRDGNLEGNYILVIGTDHIGNYRVNLE